MTAKDKPVLGLEIIRGAEEGRRQDCGKAADSRPRERPQLRCAPTPIEGGKKLEVRGSIGPFGRTQTWIRIQ